MTYLLITILAGISLIAFYQYKRYRKIVVDNSMLHTLMANMTTYVFLINRDLEVEKTNYYSLNNIPQRSKTRILGNVLQCKTACESGQCGTGEECLSCPVRFIINKSFQRRRGFQSLEVGMQMYDEKKGVTDVDISIDGRFVKSEGEPYMVLNVKNISETKKLLHRYVSESGSDGLPKLLLASHSLVFSVRVSQLLEKKCHVVFAETREQVLEQVGKGRSSDFSCVMMDETFEHAHHVIEDISMEMPVILHTSEMVTQNFGNLYCINDRIVGEELAGMIMERLKAAAAV